MRLATELLQAALCYRYSVSDPMVIPFGVFGSLVNLFLLLDSLGGSQQQIRLCSAHTSPRRLTLTTLSCPNI